MSQLYARYVTLPLQVSVLQRGRRHIRLPPQYTPTSTLLFRVNPLVDEDLGGGFPTSFRPVGSLSHAHTDVEIILTGGSPTAIALT